MVSQTSPGTGPPLLWQVEGKPVTVHMEAPVMAKLCTRALAARVEECGGLLLGRVGGDGVTRVLAFEEFEADEQHGPAYVLTHRDRLRLKARMARATRGGLQAVGLWRTHLRQGLYLDNRDFSTFQHCCPDPASVFLTVRAEGGSVRGGFFIWEEGDMHRHAPYAEFSLAEAAPADGSTRPPRRRLKTGVLAVLAAALPLGAYYAGRAVALKQQKPAPVVSEQPLVSIQLIPAPRLPLEAGDLFVPMAISHKVLPRIPRGAGLERHPAVTLAVRVDYQGHVTDVATREGDPGLAEASAAAVRQWTFTPARLNTVPVACDVLVRFTFRNP